MKEIYTAPEAEIITFEAEDVITESQRSWALEPVGE